MNPQITMQQPNKMCKIEYIAAWQAHYCTEFLMVQSLKYTDNFPFTKTIIYGRQKKQRQKC